MPPSPLTKHRLRAAISADAILTRLTMNEQEQLIQASTLQEFAKDASVYHAGDAAETLWAVVSRQIKISRRTGTGNQLIIELIRAGEMCGASCYASEGRLVFDAFAMEATVAFSFPIAFLEAAAQQTPLVMQALVKNYCRRLYHAQHMRSLASENVVGRIACALIYLQDKFGDEIPHTRRTLAELAGTSVESAIRATSRLSEKGLIETGRNRILIVSLGRLQAFAHKT